MAGLHLEAGWEAPELPPDPVRALMADNRRHGADPGPRTEGARWERERDIPVEVELRALEAGLTAVAPPAPP